MDALQMSEFVQAFKRNCPRVAMTKAEGIELERLFNEAFTAGGLLERVQRVTPAARGGGRMDMEDADA